jgi:putative restriction endonuclease
MSDGIEPSEVRDRFEDLTVWKRGSQRAPHKPLLVLYALGELERGTRWISFRDVDDKLRALLEEFGPPRTRHHPEYPFWRLQNDDVWVVRHDESLTRRASNTDPLKSELLEHDVHGGFSDQVWTELQSNSSLRGEIMHLLLDGHFPSSLHGDLLDAVGLEASPRRTVRREPRDPQFRINVLRAYDFQCAICGFDLKLDARPIGLEAAHIRWRQADGPDTVSNGIALCALHHKMLDKGAVHVSDELRLFVAEAVHGSAPHIDRLREKHGNRIHAPQRVEYAPDERHVTWHVKEVYRGNPA